MSYFSIDGMFQKVGINMYEYRVKVGEAGRLVIPAACRNAMGLQPGDEVIVQLRAGELRLFQQKKALKKIRALVKRKGVEKRGTYTDDFLHFRHEDARDA